MRLGEGRVCLCQSSHASDAWIAAEVDIESLGGVELRDQVDICQPRLVTEAEASITDQLFHRRQALADPVGDPLVDLGIVMAQLTQLVEHADVVQRVDVAADDRRHTPHFGPRLGTGRQQRRLWINLFEVLDDRR